MDESNINWILAIACLLAGVGLGALGYHLLYAGTDGMQRLRQRLAERDRELSALHDGMGEHFDEIGRLTETLRQNGEALAARLAADADTLGVRSRPARGLAMDEAATATEEGSDNTPPTPRDYADGSGGTLSEDFGLKEADSQDGEKFDAPRY
ncbi:MULTISPECIES: YhcB family protein [Halomonas]|uniref:DUF1043 family protein n=1 Tax=Halomonas icarae TaxID=2691040 RepID=A0A7X5ALI2_9GAMM|nr:MULTISPECIES: DUF1043 family protein [Halomonas]MDR5901404.1 DUF1043 family protein [Halomonas icarae]NAW11849.1 DUF1043 family protein [Halomonas icarae]